MAAFLQIVAVVLLIGLCLWIVAPFVTLVIWGVIISVAVYPAHQKLTNILGNREKLSAAILVILGLLILVIPTWMMTESSVTAARDLGASMQDGTIAIPPPADRVAGWPVIGKRLYATWNISRRHSVRALAAPLSYTETGSLTDTVAFAGSTYVPGSPLAATYQFNSWRIGYRYRITDRERLGLWIGFTAKVRDAKIELEQGATTSRDTDVGFVPLLAFAADWLIDRRWHAILDFEGLAGGPGRAFDVALQVQHDLNDRWAVSGGYRTVEGGADVDAVYNFAWFHAAVLAASYRF